MKTLKILFTTFLILFIATVAFCQENPVGEAVSRFAVDVVFPVIAAFLLGLIGLVLNKLRQKYNLQVSEQVQASIEAAALKGIAYAEEKAATGIKNGVKKVTGKEKLDAAIGYVLMTIPTVTEAQAANMVHAVLGKVSGAGATGEAAIK